MNIKQKPTYEELEKEILRLKKDKKDTDITKNIIERSPVVAFLWKNEKNWPVEFVSNNICNIFGYTVEEFLSQKIIYSEIIHPDDLERVGNEVALNSNEVFFSHKPYRIISKTGESKWIQDDTYIIRNKNGEITHYEGIIFDITDNVKKETEILKLSHAIEQSSTIIVITDIYGNIEYSNPAFTRITGYTKDEIKGQNHRILKSKLKKTKEYKTLWKTITSGKTWHGEFLNVKKNKEEYWEEAIISPVKNDRGEIINYIAVKEDITERKKAAKALINSKIKLEEAHKDITDSLTYAQTIQKALLTSKEIIDKYIDRYFILNKPKDKVSGDFYYINKKDQNTIVAIADCTGHGVPGGLISMLGITYLHEIIRRETTNNPAEVLELLRERFKMTFRTFGSDNNNGLDIALCFINPNNNTLQYAGAFNPLILIRNQELIEYKATRNPIGFFPKERNFKNNIIQTQKNDVIYLYSDGFQDQLGSMENKKYMAKNFKELLVKIHKLSIKEQEEKLNNIFEQWKGEGEQTDDVLVYGMVF